MRALTFPGRFQKSRKDAKSSWVIISWSLHLSYIPLPPNPPAATTPPYPPHKAGRQGAPWPHYVDLYPLRTRGQTEKCKFWQLPLWALTSQDSFSPRPHPGSDFPTSAIIYWQVISLPEAEGTARHNLKQSTTRVNAMNWIIISSQYQPCPRKYFPLHHPIFEDTGSTNHLQTFPIVFLSAPNKDKAWSPQPWPNPGSYNLTTFFCNTLLQAIFLRYSFLVRHDVNLEICRFQISLLSQMS